MTATPTPATSPENQQAQPGATPGPTPRFVDDRLAHWAATTPDAEAMTYLARTWTWAELDDRVRRCTGMLAGLGVGRGDVVAFLDKNHPACVELSMAAGALGAANAIINFRLAGEEIDYAVNDSGATVLLVGSELMGQVEQIRDRLTRVEHVIEVTPDGGLESDDYERRLAEATPTGRAADVDPGDTCLVMYSSGTTGHPKGVMLSHANMVAHTTNAHDGWGFEPGDKSMVAMPLFHVGGSSYVLFGIHDGIPSVMTRDPDGASLAGAILAGANRTFLVPAVLAQVLQSGPDAIKLFGALKTYTYGAAPMPPPLLRAAMEAWPDTDFMQVYGLTEVSGVATHLMPEEHRTAVADGHPERLVSAGRALPEMEVRIVDPATLEDQPTGSAGEIWLRTPQLFQGYLGKPEATAEVITPDGWFRTGDMGKVDAEGYVFVEDRLKDMIISGGENIYSPEVERVLAEHPAVMEVAVIGIPDDTWGESVKAVVALKEGESATEQEIIAYCREHLAHFKCPKTIDVLEALPRNPTGKILKRELRAPYWEGRDRAV
ncbi:Long-chain-fatty-acid--CoA ligase FadD13 [Nocardioides dokdonensis FR1436]|uniref:Long-chain-fatty-acid--CoA ligase FadD13 n=1 Tax=Nocardioides dokdonensis FR1436 TaxID=1300347 RepID=A0A1A9GJF0_9ACTN|nr:long-chain-fatty-acid--CoA ligase [Nocardioides dokdonensis]ANH38384.1 Long-chain-fatty-acid--CoA ligase FadD13 [Nocardioides dokdonensis FR1436]